MNLLDLYAQYADELYEFAHAFRPVYHRMLANKQGATFGDGEGEALYLLIRHLKPEVVFEISPDTGHSTNYILAALTKNQKGTLHSFELQSHRGGVPMEQIIRENQIALCDQKRLVVHIGDAHQTVEQVPGTIDFLFIDSEHTDVFAQWFVSSVIPRVQGTVFIQDIAFRDLREKSSEAQFVWDWLTKEKADVTLVGAVEYEARRSGVRDHLPERRALRSNSVMFAHPLVRLPEPVVLPDGPDAFLKHAKADLNAGKTKEADIALSRAVNILTSDQTRQNRHRLFMQASALYTKMGEKAEAARSAQRAMACAVVADLQQQKKIYPEMFLLLVRQHFWHLAVQTLLLIILKPRIWLHFFRSLARFVSGVRDQKAYSHL